MVDIAMCRDTECPSKDNCYRYTAIPDEYYQSYAGFTYEDETGMCEFFIGNSEYSMTRRNSND